MREADINRSYRNPTADSAISGEYRRDYLPDYKPGRYTTDELVSFAARYEARKQKRIGRRLNYRQRQLEKLRER